MVPAFLNLGGRREASGSDRELSAPGFFVPESEFGLAWAGMEGPPELHFVATFFRKHMYFHVFGGSSQKALVFPRFPHQLPHRRRAKRGAPVTRLVSLASLPKKRFHYPRKSGARFESSSASKPRILNGLHQKTLVFPCFRNFSQNTLVFPRF